MNQVLQHVDPTFMMLWAAALCVVTAVLHSVMGEVMLVRPLMSINQGVLQYPAARNVTRLSWHWTSLLWAAVAALLVAAAYGQLTATWLVWAIGGGHFVAGLLDAVFTRGRHIGWPLITLIGVFTLISAYLSL